MLIINFKWLEKSRRSSEPQPAESEAEIADRDAMRMHYVCCTVVVASRSGEDELIILHGFTRAHSN